MFTSYEFKRLAIDVIYPNRCPFCGEIINFDKYFCEPCQDIKFSPLSFYDNASAQKIENVSGAFAIFEYNEAIKPFIYALKESGDGYALSAAAEFLSKIIFSFEAFKNNLEAIDLILCVPASKKRLLERGYNPPALIAKELSGIVGVPCAVNALRKNPVLKSAENRKLSEDLETPKAQKELTALERRENVKGAFSINKRFSGRLSGNILLIDDVRTTGATLSEIAEVLLSAGANKVYAGTAAATV